MARIEIKDLPRDKKIDKKEMKKITGGGIAIEDKNPKLYGGGGIYNPSFSPLTPGANKGIIIIY
jgi:bacteriocin-like protein